ncbi:MAG: glycosyltransferase family 4 protein [Candidatus Krumholzibacteriia bacterium]
MFVSSLRRWGGGEKWMLEAALAMKQRGHRVALVAQPGAALGDRAVAAGLAVHRVRLGGWLDPGSILQLAGVLRQARAEVICANLDKEIRQARLAAGAAGRRVRLVARRGSPVPIKDTWHYRLVYRWGVSRLICNAEALVEPVCGGAPWFDRRKLRIIPNGVDVDDLDRRAAAGDVRAELGLPPGAVVVSCIGEVGWRKGQEHVLAAAERLREEFPEAVWLIAGEGDGLDDLTDRARARGLLHDGYVRFLGFRGDVPAVLAASQILVLPSRSEGFPNTLLEGMALGLPVAASRADGIPELVVHGETGFLHAIDDRQSFIGDLEHLLGDPDLRRRLGQAGRRRALATFSQPAVMDRVEECLVRW